MAVQSSWDWPRACLCNSPRIGYLRRFSRATCAQLRRDQVAVHFIELLAEAMVMQEIFLLDRTNLTSGAGSSWVTVPLRRWMNHFAFLLMTKGWNPFWPPKSMHASAFPPISRAPRRYTGSSNESFLSQSSLSCKGVVISLL